MQSYEKVIEVLITELSARISREEYAIMGKGRPSCSSSSSSSFDQILMGMLLSPPAPRPPHR